MSGIWQASVTHHSKLPEPLRHLLYLLADAANDAGIVDPAPTQETLAEMTGRSRRTVQARMKVLMDSGELLCIRAGSGPGNPSAYQFNLPLPPNMKGATKGAEGRNQTGRLDQLENEVAQQALRINSLEAQINSLQGQINDLTTTVAALVGEIKGAKGRKIRVISAPFVIFEDGEKGAKGRKRAQERAQKGARKGAKGRNEGRKRAQPLAENFAHDPILIHSDPGGDPPPPQPSPTLSDAQRQLVAMVNALAASTGMSGHLNWAVLSGFAQELITLGYTPEQISRHYSAHPASNGSHKPAWNWYQHDWRGQKKAEFPTILAIRQTISGAVGWEPPPPVNGNGHHTGAIDPAFVGSGGAF